MKTIETATKVTTSTGLQVTITSNREEVFTKLLKGCDCSQSAYDRVILDMQMKNCGCYIINEFGEPVDNEFDLEEIYGIIENLK